MVLYYQMRKIQIFPLFFWILNKDPKNNGNPKIQKSETFRDLPKSFGFLDFGIFGFLDFAENQKIQKSKTLKIISVIFGFLDFAENPKIQKPKTPKFQKSKNPTIQKSKNPKITEILLKVLDFWIFGFF